MPKQVWSLPSIPLVLDRRFEPTPTGVPPIFDTEYWLKIFTIPAGRGERIFDTATNLQRDEGIFWYRGFPCNRYTSMQLCEFFVRVKQLFDYILPPLFKETQNTDVLMPRASSRRPRR